MKKHLVLVVTITAIAIGCRLILVLKTPNEDDDDGRYYAQIANNLLDGRGYSGETEEPFVPTLVRVPGYPLFLAGVFSISGRRASAVRFAQVVVDTITCWFVGLIAFLWSPPAWSEDKKYWSLWFAATLAALCPFTAIYAATMLTETLATFCSTAFLLVATIAFRRDSRYLWGIAGLLAGICTMVRPDAAIFAGAVGLVLVIFGWTEHKKSRAVVNATLLASGFIILLLPWTIRNAVVFRVFQPVAPMYANTPDEFAPRGYIAWLWTWVDDERYVSPFEDALDLYPIDSNALPHKAFDTPEERSRVAELLDQYNHAPPPPEDAEDDDASDSSADQNPDGSKATEQKGDSAPPIQYVRMTPQIDEAFGKLAAERARRHPMKCYVLLPLTRAVALWFDTHSQYYPFQGQLFPLYDLDTQQHQQYWLTGFLIVLWVYTLMAIGGVMILLRDKASRRWILLLALLIVPRLMFLSWQEHPETRYTVEFFPLVIAVGAIAASRFICHRELQSKAATN